MNSDLDLCIPLYITAKSFRNEHARRLKKLGLTFTQFIVMTVLWEDAPLMVKEIGKKLELDSGTLTPVLKKLEEKGYVIRSQSEEDARDLVVTLTEAGYRLKSAVEKYTREMQEKTCRDPEKMEKIRELLCELLDSIKEMTDEKEQI